MNVITSSIQRCAGKARPFLTPALLLMALILVSFDAYSKDLLEQCNDLAAENNKHLPSKVTDHVALIFLDCSAGTIGRPVMNYKFKMLTNITASPEDVHQLRDETVRDACRNQDAQQMLRFIDMKYYYYNADNTLIYGVLITPAECVSVSGE